MKPPKQPSSAHSHFVQAKRFHPPLRCMLAPRCNVSATHLVGWSLKKKVRGLVRDQAVRRSACCDHALGFAARFGLSLPQALPPSEDAA